MNHTHDGHAVVTIIDPVDVSIRSASGAVSILDWWTEPLPDAMWVVKQRTNDELVRREGERLWQMLGERPPSRG